MADVHLLDLTELQLRHHSVEEQRQLPIMLLTDVMQVLQLQERSPLQVHRQL